MAERAVRVTVIGRVQGVGFRAWLEDRARAHQLAGWVRNRRDGSVEAVLAGDANAVGTVVEECATGPRLASVFHVDVVDDSGPPPGRFTVLPTE